MDSCKERNDIRENPNRFIKRWITDCHYYRERWMDGLVRLDQRKNQERKRQDLQDYHRDQLKREREIVVERS